MKILLIRPPYSRLKGIGQSPYFPLGLGYLAAVLEKNGFEVKIYHAENPHSSEENIVTDAEITFWHRSLAQRRYLETIKNSNHYVWKEAEEVICSFQPDLVGISVLSSEVASALNISKICKRYRKDCWVVWGGCHPTFLPESCLLYPEVDFVIRGEGELSFLEFCQNLEGKIKLTDLSQINGLSYKKDGRILHNRPRALIENLDEIPFPARHLILFPEFFDYRALGSMITSRGCPWRCGFCSSRNFWQKKVRFRSPENVIEEIKGIQKRYKINYLMFWDDCFTANRNVVLKILRGMIKSKFNIAWRTATRADLIDEELLSLMKRAGCTKLEIGVETGSPRIQRLIKKDINNTQIKNAFHLLCQQNVPSGAFFMAGFPEETKKDLEETFTLLKQIPSSEIAFNIFDPMPGSELWDRCIELKLIPRNPDFLTFRFWPDNHFMKFLEKERFNKIVKEMATWVFRYNNSLRNRIKRLRFLIIFLIKNDPLLLFRKIFSFLRGRLKLPLRVGR